AVIAPEPDRGILEPDIEQRGQRFADHPLDHPLHACRDEERAGPAAPLLDVYLPQLFEGERPLAQLLHGIPKRFPPLSRREGLKGDAVAPRTVATEPVHPLELVTEHQEMYRAGEEAFEELAVRAGELPAVQSSARLAEGCVHGRSVHPV